MKKLLSKKLSTKNLSVGKFPKLEELYLSKHLLRKKDHNRIGDEGMQVLSAAHLPLLQELNVGNCLFTQ